MHRKILIAGHDKSALKALESQLSGYDHEISIRHMNNGHADPLHGVPDLPDLLIFHMDDSNDAELRCLADRPAELRPVTLVIGPSGNTGLMRLAMKAGALDYLEDPADEADLQEALHETQMIHSHQATTADGELIAVVSAKGGSGASFLSANIGHIMQSMSNKKTALIDLDLQYASLGQYLDVQSEHGLMQALDVVDGLDETALDAYMAKHSSGLSLLAPLPDEIILTRDVPLERLSRLLELMKTHYDYTLIDQTRELHDVSAAVYERADRVLIVMQQELANLRDASRLRQILISSMAVPEEQITMVVNRHDKQTTVQAADISRALGIDKRDLVIMPNDYRGVADSVNIGVPMMIHSRNSPVTKSLMMLESMLTGRSTSPDKTGVFAKAISNLIRG